MKFFVISCGLQSRAAYIFYFFTLSKGLDDALSFLHHVLSTKLFFRIRFSSASRAHPGGIMINRRQSPSLLLLLARSTHTYFCSSRTSRSWWITQSTQHHRTGCNSTLFVKPFGLNTKSLKNPFSKWCCRTITEIPLLIKKRGIHKCCIKYGLRYFCVISSILSNCPKTLALCGSPLLKKKTTTHLGQFRESTD